MDISKFQLRKVNPFQGLVIDADTWKDAHNYHRDQQRLHILAFHKTGIVTGLEVTASKPPELSVNISPGMAVDPDGNVIIVSQKQRYRLQTREKGIVYLVIQFREVPAEPYQPPEGGQPTRLLDAYRIQERDKLPSEPYVELARIDFDPTNEAVKDAKNQAKPGTNEINLHYREQAMAAVPERVSAAPIKESEARSKETITIGHSVLGEASKDLHIAGLGNLINEINRQGGLTVTLEENIPLNKALNRYNLVYLTGNSRFELTQEQQTTLGNFLQAGGTIFGQGCSAGGAETKTAKEFALAFNRLASQFNYKLSSVQRGHLLLSNIYVFSEVPPGCEPGMLLESGNMICSGSDYGCAWEGGHPDHPLSRDVIRSAFEIGANIIAYAQMAKATKR